MADSTFINDYGTKIFSLAQKETDEVFYNSSTTHASIVHRALATYAKNYIEIFSSSMCTEISNNNDYIIAIDNFLKNDRSHEIRIILTSVKDEFSSSPISYIFRKYPEQVHIKRYSGKIQYDGKEAHFTVADGKAFRLETDIEKHMAFGNFNKPSQAGDLHKIFNDIYNSEYTQEYKLQ